MSASTYGIFLFKSLTWYLMNDSSEWVKILSWIQNEKFNINKQPLIIFFIVLYKYHISPFLKQRQRETYYNGVIKPTLLYGSMIWDSCNVEHLQSILKLQKRAACIILDAERFTPSVILFNNLNWLPFTEQSLIKRCAQVYKRVHNYIMPSYLNNLLVRNSEIHNRATRHSNINLMCPKYKRKSGGRTFTIRTIKDWNCMNADIRNNGSLASFKHNVFKSFLAEQKAAMRLRL